LPAATPEEILGLTIPDGHYDLSPERHAQVMHFVRAPESFTSEPGDAAHPVFAHLANQCGMAWTFDDFLAAVGASAADGVVIGSGTFDFVRPITVGVDYTVRARFVDVQRRHGRRMGDFDAITVALELLDGTEGVVTMHETYVVPRGPAPDVEPGPPAPVAAAGDGYPVGPIDVADIVGLMRTMHDTNPIHDDRAVAVASGFRGIVNQAPANLAYIFNAMAIERGGLSDLRRVEFAFRDAVVEGDRLEVRLTDDGRDGTLVIIDGGPAVTCRVEFG
jgi:acyl dehydratase